MNTVNYKSIEARSFMSDMEIQTVSINNNVRLTSVSERDERICVDFIYTSNYEPNIGVIRIEGEVLIGETEENRKKTLEEWKTSNKRNLPHDIAGKIHNTILGSCMIETAVLSREIKLPPPFPLPQVNLEKKEAAVSVGSETTRSYIR